MFEQYNPYMQNQPQPYRQFMNAPYSQPSLIQQPTQQPMAMPINNDFRFMTEEEFTVYVVNPNCRLFAYDKGGMKFMIKSTDMAGKVEIEKFNLVKENERVINNADKTETMLQGYITKTDFNGIIDTMKKEFDDKLANLNKSFKEDLNKSIKIKDILQGDNK